MIFSFLRLCLRPAVVCAVAVLTIAGATGAVQTRKVRINDATIERGQEGVVKIELDALGNENTLGFSLNFDTGQLAYVSAELGEDVPAGSTLLLNANQTAAGRLGVAITLPFGASFSAGTKELFTVRFAAATEGNAPSTPVSFGNVPVGREIVGSMAEDIPFDNETFENGDVALTRTAATVSAASFIPSAEVAPESIVAAFGSNLATGLGIPEGELPEILLGTSVKVRDSAGAERASKLFFVFNTQVNFQIPPETAEGTATVTIQSGDGSLSVGIVEISAVAPGIFAANANGAGVAAAQALRVRNGNIFFEPTAQFDGSVFIPLPIDLGPETDQVFLVLYGTGIRFHGSLQNVSVMIGDQTFPALYADFAPGFTGLDQINAGPIPRSMAGAGVLDVKVNVAGKPANTVTIRIQ
ncbi:MAG: hypothetical protein KIT57_15270 [Blastocatellales bacterium]|nr:hypothetical protein [Blastocatellales bacterium]